jgi:hypothetical protein
LDPWRAFGLTLTSHPPHTPGFVAAQCRAALPPAALSDAVRRLLALLPAFERQPLTAGAAALALGYLGATGPLPDVAAAPGAEGAAKAQDGAAVEAKEGSPAALDSGFALARVAALLPTTAVIGARETSQSATAALGRAAAAVGLGCLGDERPEVLRAAVKGERAWALGVQSPARGSAWQGGGTGRCLIASAVPLVCEVAAIPPRPLHSAPGAGQRHQERGGGWGLGPEGTGAGCACAG